MIKWKKSSFAQYALMLQFRHHRGSGRAKIPYETENSITLAKCALAPVKMRSKWRNHSFALYALTLQFSESRGIEASQDSPRCRKKQNTSKMHICTSKNEIKMKKFQFCSICPEVTVLGIKGDRGKPRSPTMQKTVKH